MDHFWFIAGSYGISGLVMAALVAWVMLDGRSLTRRLKELEAEGIVRRTVVASTPVRVDYALTEKGQALSEVIAAVSTWAEEWLAPTPEATSLEIGRKE